MNSLWPIAQFLYNAKDFLVFRDVFRCLSFWERDFITNALFAAQDKEINEALEWAADCIEPTVTAPTEWEVILAHALLHGSWITHYKTALLLSDFDRARIKQILLTYNTDAAFKAIDRLTQCETLLNYRYSTTPHSVVAARS